MPTGDELVLAVDQGTSSTKALLVDTEGRIVARGQAPVAVDYPAPGHVEQSPARIWTSVQEAIAQCLHAVPQRRIAAVGLSSQRESVLMWNRASGLSEGPVLGWQDRRTAAACRELAPVAESVRHLSGLPLDPMFSASKIAWLLQRFDPQCRRAAAGDLCVGTIDAWLLRCLTGGHQTEAGNASRTQLLDVRSGAWSDELFKTFGVPREVLPDVVASVGTHFGEIVSIPALKGVPVRSVLADSHAALFAHTRQPGQIKATYGTGSSVIGLVESPQELPDGLCLTIAWQTDRIAYAAEGNIYATGATLTWLAKLLDLPPSEVLSLAEGGSDGVVLVPAFDGLGAPWWDDQAVAIVSGLSLATGREQLARAALESIASQVTDVVDAVMRNIPAGSARTVFADGGISVNDTLMQIQADRLGMPVRRARNPESSAMGAAYLAHIGAGHWSADDLEAVKRDLDTFEPGPGAALEHERHRQWRQALTRARWRPDGP